MLNKTKEQLLTETEALQKEITRLKALHDNEEKYREFFEQSSDGFVLIDAETADIVEFNDSAFKCLGYTREEFISIRLQDLGVLESHTEKKKHMAQIFVNSLAVFETKHKRKDGKILDILTRSKPITISGKRFFLSVWIDITNQKLSENLLLNSKKELEDTVTTMKVLLKQREKDKAAIEENILPELKKLVEPQIKKLHNVCTNQEQKKYLAIIESNLKELGEKFSIRLSSKYFNLTVSESQIANLIKHNRTSKEVSEIMNISISTVNFHRKNIRNKLNIKNTKTNLKSYLSTL